MEESSSKAVEPPMETAGEVNKSEHMISQDKKSDEADTNVDDNAKTVQAVSSVASDSTQSESTTHSQFRINILILGTIGSGKATLANKIANEEIFTPSDDFVRAPMIRPGRSASDEFAFLLVDTFGPFQVKDYREMYSYHNIQQMFKQYMHEGVNLIIATVRKGCSSPDEIKVLNYIIRERFTKSVNEYFILIITACEEVGFSKRNAFLKSMHQTTEDTKCIFDYALKYKGVHITSFPNLNEVDDTDTKAVFRKKIEASKGELQQILKNCKTQLYFKEIFGDVNAKEKKTWSLLPSKEVASTCIQS